MKKTIRRKAESNESSAATGNEKPLPDDPSLSEIDPGDPKGSADKRWLSEDGATCGELGITEVEVTVGPEKFSPVQYMTVDVGAITIRCAPKPEERANQVYRRVYDQAHRYFNESFERTVKAHLERVKRQAEMADRA